MDPKETICFNKLLLSWDGWKITSLINSNAFLTLWLCCLLDKEFSKFIWNKSSLVSSFWMSWAKSGVLWFENGFVLIPNGLWFNLHSSAFMDVIDNRVCVRSSFFILVIVMVHGHGTVAFWCLSHSVAISLFLSFLFILILVYLAENPEVIRLRAMSMRVRHSAEKCSFIVKVSLTPNPNRWWKNKGVNLSNYSLSISLIMQGTGSKKSTNASNGTNISSDFSTLLLIPFQCIFTKRSIQCSTVDYAISAVTAIRRRQHE